MDSAQEGASRCVGTCRRSDQKNLTSTFQAEPTPALSKSMQCATQQGSIGRTVSAMVGQVRSSSAPNGQ